MVTMEFRNNELNDNNKITFFFFFCLQEDNKLYNPYKSRQFRARAACNRNN